MSEWHRPRLPTGRDSGLREYPRRAGISSFGAGGSNAHVLIEEYIGPAERQRQSAASAGSTPSEQPLKAPRLIVLSARNAEQLTALAVRLHDHLRERAEAGEVIADAELADIAYTLQVGREAMDERLAMAVDNTRKLLENLAAFIEGREDIDGCHRGQVRRHKDTLAAFNADEDMEDTLVAWASKQKFDRLLDLWVKGLAFDWHRLYDGGRRPGRVSLPTYPFARRRYWVDGAGPIAGVEPATGLSRLHPLVHQNTSILSEQRFSSVFTGREFFLKDHRVNGVAVLPGAAYLEMARAALERAGVLDAGAAVQLGNVVWTRPLVVTGAPERVHISLTEEPSALNEEENGAVAFKIYGDQSGAEPAPVYCTGLYTGPASKNAGVEERVDIARLRAQCTLTTLSASACYNAFKAMGLDYGPAHRGVEEIYVGADRVLARLSLPAAVRGGRDEFALHPSLLDAALQATVGLLLRRDERSASITGHPRNPPLPFALQSLRLFAPCPTDVWALIKPADKDNPGSRGGIRRLNIDLLDDEGRLCLRLLGFSTRVLERDLPGATTGATSAGDRSALRPARPLEATGHASTAGRDDIDPAIPATLLLRPVWEPAQVGAMELNAGSRPGPWIVLCDETLAAPEARLQRELETLGADVPAAGAVRVARLTSPHATLENRFQDYARQLLETIQAESTQKPLRAGFGVSLQVVIRGRDEARLFSGLRGLLDTARLENPKLTGQLIEWEPAPDSPVAGLPERLWRDLSAPRANHIRYRREAAGQSPAREVAGWREFDASASTTRMPWKDGGVYLITGGAGGLGLIVAGEIARRATAPHLVLTGRSEPDAGRRARLDAIAATGARVDYRRVDVADGDALAALILAVQTECGGLDGIVHSAGVTRDSFIFNKTAADLEQVLAAKVAGAVNLDRASRALDLDFFMLFSSIAGAFGNAGQADYAAANAFMDAFAHYRNDLVAAGQRRGRTLSINWPLWREGGMRVGAGIEKLMSDTYGLVPLETEAGTEALHRAWTLASDAGLAQVLVLSGRADKILRTLPLTPAARDAAKGDAPGVDSGTAGARGSAAGTERRATTVTASAAETSVSSTGASEIIGAEKGMEGAAAGGGNRAGGYGDGDPLTAVETASECWEEKLQSRLIQAVSRVLKVDEEEIDVGEELSAYGFDSVTLTSFTNALNREYGLALAPTVFFEYSTLADFQHHLLAEHRDKLAGCLHSAAEPPGGVAPAEPSGEIAAGNPSEGTVTGAPALDTRRAGVVEFRGRRRSPLGRGTGEKAVSRRREPRDDHLRHPASEACEPIAIVGVSGCFPAARDIDAFWDNLREGRDCIGEIPPQRWNWRELYGDPHAEANKTAIKWGGFIDGVDEFDPLFFGISPHEAELMDPQQRLLMTHVWKAIEDAGYAPGSLAGTRTGVFVATASSGYGQLVADARVAVEGYTATGMVPSVGPNRMSYLLDLHGPSEPIETACSSSLVAIHRAVGAIESDQCDMALVGGVNTIVTPQAHISFDKAGMLSPDGRCKTFSARADGYVRGEGVGILFLKRRSAAERGRDTIYGLIRGSAENHGGRANSLTAPNPKAQAALLRAAYLKAGVAPDSVGYIEAHGTGTELGDPIEINGLKSAFRDLYLEAGLGDGAIAAPHCGLGSVKSNIGHLELASGVAGVIKVLLQLKHRTLVKTLHCETLNPYIELQGSPFYIVRENHAWPRSRDSAGREIPRRAGVSSFGFGGVNAHVVIEEYCSEDNPLGPIDNKRNNTKKSTQVIVLSAKNADRLNQSATDLKAWLARVRQRGEEPTAASENRLARIAYTLQVGRDAMEERLALVVNSLGELESGLEAFLAGRDDREHLYLGRVERGRESLMHSTGADLASDIDTWVAQRRYDKLLPLWVKGLPLDWETFHGGDKPRRISLPTYPFAPEQYWVSPAPGDTGGSAGDHPAPVALHPLLHRNSSDFVRQRFTSTFTGTECFLRDHRVNGRPVLPAVAFLEMARAALCQALGSGGELGDVELAVRFKNVAWSQPLRLSPPDQTQRPATVHIELCPQDGGEVAFEIYSQPQSGDGGDTVLHCGGICDYGTAATGPAPPALNIAALRRDCDRRTLSAQQCYAVFEAMGLDYGPTHRGIETIFVGRDQALARLSLPAAPAAGDNPFVLHPGLADAALQACVGLYLQSREQPPRRPDPRNPGDGRPAPLLLPFALQSLHIFKSCATPMWARVREAAASDASRVRQFDIELCADDGAVCASLAGLAFRVLEQTDSVAVEP
ncbi:MAG: SDR family NAD(P)-dependent oxidoreductase, partial [Exilibacterium sp.]